MTGKVTPKPTDQLQCGPGDAIVSAKTKIRTPRMSEFKFACPACGQHITCAANSSGSPMECPTCYRKLVVPQPPAAGSPNLILTAAEVHSRPAPLPGSSSGVTLPAGRKLPLAAIGLVVLVCAAGAGVFVFREKIFKTSAPNTTSGSTTGAKKDSSVSPSKPASNTNWTLHLADVKTPAAPVAGWINGQSFQLEKAVIKGGTLDLRQGSKWPPDLGLTVQLFANQAEDLAGKTVILDADRDAAPKIVLRWKDDAGQPVTSNFRQGYAARIEFGTAAGGRLSGKIYLCAPDDAKSYVAGTFDAEIRKPTPPKKKPRR